MDQVRPGPATPAAGQVIAGRYRLQSQIGRGGMGRVFRAEHLELGRIVAVKILEPVSDVPHAAERFLREARSTASLRHPNIVEVLDFGHTEHGAPFIVMEFLDGQDLATLLRYEHPMSWPRVRHYMSQLAEGLAKAHDEGLIHRDLKPENCLVVAGDVLKIVDFGTAKTTNPEDTRLTGVGALIGTPAYMSPEQARGEDVDRRADVYAVGVIAYTLLTGSPPFSGRTFMDVLIKHIHEPVPLPSSRNAGLSSQVDQLLMRALDKDPNHRFPDMRSFQQALHAIDVAVVGPPSLSFEGPAPLQIGPTGPTRIDSPKPPSSRGVAWIVAATALVVMAVMGAAVWALT